MTPIHVQFLIAETDHFIESHSLLDARGSTHRHIVLAVRHEGNWGAIGISRRENLMDKKIEFKTLADLLRDFKLSYVSLVFTCFDFPAYNPQK